MAKKKLHDASIPSGGSVIAPFNLSRSVARKHSRTFYSCADLCAVCTSAIRWTHTGNCMRCSPRDGDRLGIDGGGYGD